MRSDVRSKTQFTVCPLSNIWGCSPTSIDHTTNQINITILSSSCVVGTFHENHSIELGIYLSSNKTASSTTQGVNTSVIFPCTPNVDIHGDLEANATPSPLSLVCDLNRLNDMAHIEEGDNYMFLVWRPRSGTNSSYQWIGDVGEVPPIAINFTSSSHNSDCSLSEKVGKCSPCDIVQTDGAFNLSCLQLDCSIDDGKSFMETYSTLSSVSSFSPFKAYQELYIRPSCENSICEKTFTHDLDRNAICCNLEHMDCLGVCNGTSRNGYDAAKTRYDCCHSVDCLGICGGSSVNDCRGVCNGTYFIDECGVCSDGSHDCPPVNITVDPGPNPYGSAYHISAEYDAFDDSYLSMHSIVVTNTNDVIIDVTFSEVEPHPLPPFFILPEGSFGISPLSNVSFLIYSNLSALRDDSYSTWAVNTIKITYVQL